MPYVPAAIRYNNPGAQYPGPSASAFGSTGYGIIGGGHKIAQFPDPVSGAAAQFNLLTNGPYSKMPLGQAIRKWSGNNSSDAYIRSIADETGLDPSKPVTARELSDPNVAIPLAKAMAKFESGRDFPLADEDWQAAHSLAFGGGAPSAEPYASGSPAGNPVQQPYSGLLDPNEEPPATGNPMAGNPMQASDMPMAIPRGGSDMEFQTVPTGPLTAGRAPPPGPPTGNLPFGIPGTIGSNPIQQALGDNFSTLLAFAGGARQGGIGQGLSQAAKASLIEGPENRKLAQQNQTQNAVYAALRQKGVPHPDAVAMSVSPELFKAQAPEIFGNNWKFDKLDNGFGGQTPVWVNSRTQEIRPVGGGSADATNALGGFGNINSNLKGDEYLAQFPPELQAAVKAYEAGDASSTSNPRKGFAEAVKKIAQKHSADIGEPVNDAKFLEMANFRRELGKTSPQSVGGQRNLAHTSISHLLQAGETFEKLKNTDVPGPAVLSSGVNYARNLAADNARKGEINALAGNAEKYSQEVTKFYAGGPGTGGERERTAGLFSPTNSKETQAIILSKERDLLAGKLEALEHQKNEALGRNASTVEITNKQGREDLAKLDALIARLKGTAAPAEASSSAAPTAVPAVQQFTPQQIQQEIERRKRLNVRQM